MTYRGVAVAQAGSPARAPSFVLHEEWGIDLVDKRMEGFSGKLSLALRPCRLWWTIR